MQAHPRRARVPKTAVGSDRADPSAARTVAHPPLAPATADWDRRYGAPAMVRSDVPNGCLVDEGMGPSHGRALYLANRERRDAVWLAPHCRSVTGVDFSSVALQKAECLTSWCGILVHLVQADLASCTPGVAGAELIVVFYLHVDGERGQARLRGRRPR